MKMKPVVTRKAWNDTDTQELIALYFSFLTDQQNNIAFTKAGPVRELAAKQGRSKGSIECKLMNISAVLQGMFGVDFVVKGYKCLSNYNAELPKQVTTYLEVSNKRKFSEVA